MVNDNDIKLASVGGSVEQANESKPVMRAANATYNNGDMIVTPNWDVYFVENGRPVLKGNIKGATGATGAPGKDGTNGAPGVKGDNGSSVYPCTSVINEDGSTLVSSIIMPSGRSIAVGDMLVSTNNGGVAQVILILEVLKARKVTLEQLARLVLMEQMVLLEVKYTLARCN